MFDFLFKSRSPLLAWFILMELLTAACIIGFWVEFFCGDLSRWERGRYGSMAIVTALFVASNALLFRHRKWAIPGFIICWFFLAAALLPAL